MQALILPPSPIRANAARRQGSRVPGQLNSLGRPPLDVVAGRQSGQKQYSRHGDERWLRRRRARFCFSRFLRQPSGFVAVHQLTLRRLLNNRGLAM